MKFQRKSTAIIGKLLIIVFMITVSGYFMNKLLPKGYVTKKG